jgi:hypothetical protein
VTYEAGAQLSGGTPAPDRRVGIFTEDLFANWTATAKTLVLRSLLWAGGVGGAAATYDISGNVSEDINGDAGMGDAAASNNVTVVLYQDGGDGQPDGVDDGAPVGTTTTDGSGNYSFSGLGNGTYWVIVDSKTISPNAGIKGGFAQGDVWRQWGDQCAGCWRAVFWRAVRHRLRYSFGHCDRRTCHPGGGFRRQR